MAMFMAVASCRRQTKMLRHQSCRGIIYKRNNNVARFGLNHDSSSINNNLRHLSAIASSSFSSLTFCPLYTTTSRTIFENHRQNPSLHHHYHHHRSSFSTTPHLFLNLRNQPNKKKKEKDPFTKSDIVISILGPPNAGKSTLFNRLLCKELNKSYRLSADKKQQSSSLRGSLKPQHRRVNSKNKSKANTKKLRKHVSGTAIVSSVPGTTRDRRECWGRIGGTVFKLIDTAGIDGDRILLLQQSKHNKHIQQQQEQQLNNEFTEKIMYKSMMEQTQQAALASDVVFLMFDAKVGLTNDLKETARWLRKLNKNTTNNNNNDNTTLKKMPKIILLANKLEGDKWVYDPESPVLEHLQEATRIGFGEAIPISAEHGDGMADLAVEIETIIAAKQQEVQDQSDDGDDDDDDDDLDNVEFPSNNDTDNDVDNDIDIDTDTDIDIDTDIDNDDNEIDTFEKKPLQLAILGRPNVGKSTLVNALLQQNRVIVGSTPGLTRDSIAVEWSWKGIPIQLVDTAGIRKISSRFTKGTIDNSNQDYKTKNIGGTGDDGITTSELEEMAVADAIRAMKVADVAVLVLDAQAMYLQRHELAIANAIVQEGRALVVVVNKMDLLGIRDENVKHIDNSSNNENDDDKNDDDKNEIEDDDDDVSDDDADDTTLENKHSTIVKNKATDFHNHLNDKDLIEYLNELRLKQEEEDDEDNENNEDYTPTDFEASVRTQLEDRFPMLRKTPIVAMSSLHGDCVDKLMPIVVQARLRWSQIIPTGVLNRWFLTTVIRQNPPPQPIKLKYIIQTKGRPPTFIIFGNNDNPLPDNYIGYIKRHFQDTFYMYGMNVRILVKQSAKQNPFIDKNKKKQQGSGIGGKDARKKRLYRQLQTHGKIIKNSRRRPKKT